MKKLVLAALLVAGAAVVSFAQTTPARAHKAKAKTATKAKAKTPAAKMATTVFACPMKCEKPSKTAGKCSKCGMDLVATKQ